MTRWPTPAHKAAYKTERQRIAEWHWQQDKAHAWAIVKGHARQMLKVYVYALALWKLLELLHLIA